MSLEELLVIKNWLDETIKESYETDSYPTNLVEQQYTKFLRLNRICEHPFNENKYITFIANRYYDPRNIHQGLKNLGYSNMIEFQQKFLNDD